MPSAGSRSTAVGELTPRAECGRSGYRLRPPRILLGSPPPRKASSQFIVIRPHATDLHHPDTAEARQREQRAVVKVIDDQRVQQQVFQTSQSTQETDGRDVSV